MLYYRIKRETLYRWVFVWILLYVVFCTIMLIRHWYTVKHVHTGMVWGQSFIAVWTGSGLDRIRTMHRLHCSIVSKINNWDIGVVTIWQHKITKTMKKTRMIQDRIEWAEQDIGVASVSSTNNGPFSSAAVRAVHVNDCPQCHHPTCRYNTLESRWGNVYRRCPNVTPTCPHQCFEGINIACSDHRRNSSTAYRLFRPPAAIIYLPYSAGHSMFAHF